LATDGSARGTSEHFFSCPLGAELCGPMFTPDDRTLFVAVQHPGEEKAAGKPGTFEAPATRWPDFRNRTLPRPALVVINKEDGGAIAVA
jgi:secreted PhoX family phosphatase